MTTATRKPMMVLLAAALGAAVPAAASGVKEIDPFRLGVPQARVPGVALLKLRGFTGEDLIVGKNRAAANAALKELAGAEAVEIELVRPISLGWALVEVRERSAPSVIPNEEQTLAIIDRLAQNPAVEKVAQNTWMRALRTPNDPGLNQMWHLDAIGARAAWDRTQGTTAQRVGIIDTGLVRSHEDVGSRAVAGFDFVSSAQAGTDGNGRDTDFNDTGDNCGSGNSFHGTHVAGTIGARTDNSTGIAGLNWNAGLVIGRALGACGGDIVDIGDAAVWMAGGQVNGVTGIGANKVQVMNLSLGSDAGCSSFEQDVVNFVNQQGSIFVAAAGNSAAPVGSPASCNGAVAVAAHGPSGNLTNYSSFGAQIAIVAPGGDSSQGNASGVLSSIGPNADGYTFQQGTSMASPHVAGAISLMLALDSSLTRTQIVTLLQQNGVACGGCGTKVRMKLDATLAAIGTGTPPPPPPPAPTDDTLEENDTFDQAKSGIGCGDERALVALPADQDWFVIDAAAGQTVDISITTPSGADLDLYVLDGPTNDDVIAASETATGNEAVSLTGTGADLHIVVNPFVDNQSGTQHQGAYTINIACTGGDPADPSDPTDPQDPIGPDPEAAEDALEENDTAEDAAEMFCDEARPLTLKDDDFFFVEVRDGDDLTAEITAAGVDYESQILDADGDVIADGNSEDRATATNLKKGVYTVRVHPTGEFGTYRLKTSCTAIDTQMNVEGGCSASGSAAPVFGALGLLALLARRRR